jgi:hypothetical protein
MANLFEAGLVLAVAFALLSLNAVGMAEFFSSSKETFVVKNPGQTNMEIIHKKGQQIERFKASGQIGEGRGTELGSIYRLENGSTIFVPNSTGN